MTSIPRWRGNRREEVGFAQTDDADTRVLVDMRPFHCFINDEYLGTGVAKHGISHHYLCPTCGAIWARTIFDPPTEHHSLSINCPEHDVIERHPSTMFYSFRFYDVRWPTEVLTRDFLYLMSLKDQFISHNLPEFSHDQHQAA
jgi:hypothetical protein